MPRSMALLVAFLLGGCAAPAADGPGEAPAQASNTLDGATVASSSTSQPSSESPTSGQPSTGTTGAPGQPPEPPAPEAADERLPRELAGENVTWVGQGSASLPLVVPPNASLAFSRWSDGALTRQVRIVVELPGCPDYTAYGTGGVAHSVLWCEEPLVGPATATVSVEGILEGRVCIMAFPVGALPDEFCDFAP